jgi:hypothetical protein
MEVSLSYSDVPANFVEGLSIEGPPLPKEPLARIIRLVVVWADNDAETLTSGRLTECHGRFQSRERGIAQPIAGSLPTLLVAPDALDYDDLNCHERVSLLWLLPLRQATFAQPRKKAFAQ